MDIAILGTGTVGQAVAGRPTTLGHHVPIGTRDVAQTLCRSEPDGLGNPPFGVWSAAHPAVQVTTSRDAAAGAEVVVNATNGAASVTVLEVAGAEAGDDVAAKAVVTTLLGELGHDDVIDIGDITAARGVEMMLPIWLRLMGSLGTPMFAFKVVR